MLDTLDALITTIGVVFVLSLIVQAIQQIIKQLFSFKSRYMKRELMAMFGAVGGPRVKTDRLQTSALAAPLAATIARWTPRNADIMEMIDLLKKRLAGFGYNDLSLIERIPADRFVTILRRIGEELPSGTRASLQQTVEQAVHDAEEWYDFTIQAFQDHYERRMKVWSYALSFILVAMLNVSVFEAFREFQSSEALRASAVKSTEALVAAYQPPKAKTDADGPTFERFSALVDSQLSVIDSLVAIRSFQLWRWDQPGRDTLYLRGPIERSTLSYFLEGVGNDLFGILLMALLVGLGAPFWYDILKAVMGLKQRSVSSPAPASAPLPEVTTVKPRNRK